MQKWEYKVVERKRTYGFFAGLQEDINVEELLPQLGEEGWELVNVVPISSDYGEHRAGFTSEEKWVFKRPKGNTAG